MTSTCASHLTRTDKLDHSWSHFRQMQAAADKRADQQILYLKADQTENAKHITMLQQENAAIIQDMRAIHDHQTDKMKQYWCMKQRKH